MKSLLKNKFLPLILTLAMGLSFMVTPISIHAAITASDFVTLEKHNSYTQDGKFYMSFTINNTVVGRYDVFIWAKLFNSSGKEIFNWSNKKVNSGESLKNSYGANYSELPTGKYTFKFYCSVYSDRSEASSWSYTINHDRKESFSFKSYETYYDSNGYYMHKFYIQCTNMKGLKLTIKIYDKDGNFLYKCEGGERKTNDEVGWFSWSGYSEGVRYPSGEYTVTISSSGSSKIIEKAYNLKILEKSK